LLTLKIHVIVSSSLSLSLSLSLFLLNNSNCIPRHRFVFQYRLSPHTWMLELDSEIGVVARLPEYFASFVCVVWSINDISPVLLKTLLPSLLG